MFRISALLGGLISVFGVTALALAADDQLMKQAQGLFQPVPSEAPAIKGVTATPAMVELGKELPFDPRLSQSPIQLQHLPSDRPRRRGHVAGVHRPQMAEGWAQRTNRAQRCFQRGSVLDGRAADLKAQAGGPIQNPIEMGITHEHAIEMLKGIPGHAPSFTAAYPDVKDPITMPNAVTAIAAFEATLITDPLDKYLRGDANALTAEQKEGLKLFIDTGCASCHSASMLVADVRNCVRCGREARRRYPASQ